MSIFFKSNKILLLLIVLLFSPLFSIAKGVTLAKSVNIFWVIFSAALVFLMQAGFLMLESGMVRSKNTINVAIKNIFDFAIGSLIFFMIGYGLMFGESHNGWVGTNLFFLEGLSTGKEYAFFLFQVAFMGTAATIVSGAVAERIKFIAYLIISIMVSLVIYPVFGHWVWGGGWLGKMGFVDFAGSTVVHSLGGWVALAGVVVLGARRDKFDENGKPRKIMGHNIPASALGVLIIWFGWFGFNGGSTLSLDDSIALIIVNTCLAASAGGVFALFLSWALAKKPSIEDCLNGVVGGLVAITAGCNLVSPNEAVIIGIVAGVITTLGVIFVERVLKLDDVISAFSVHSLAGIWGTLIIAFFAPESAGVKFNVQLVGVVVCAGWSFGTGLITFLLIKFTIKLRVTPEEEEQGLNISEHGAQTTFTDLIKSLQNMTQNNDFSNKVSVEYGTETGAVAGFFNHFIDNFSKVIYSLRRNSNTLEESSKDLGESSKEISTTVNQQAAVLEEVSATLEDLTESVEAVYGSVSAQLETAQEVDDGLILLKEKSQKTKNEINEISKIVSESAKEAKDGEEIVQLATEAISQIGDRAKEIHSVLNLINDISDQTNLLSLNASIEAARAGKAGKGFAIVAQEVSKLSDSTAVGVKKISDLINLTIKSVKDGTVKVNEMASTLNRIIARVNHLETFMGELKEMIAVQSQSFNKIESQSALMNQLTISIEYVTNEQKNSISEITESVSGITSDASSFTESYAKIVGMADILSSKSKQIKSTISQFKVGKFDHTETLN